MRFSKTLTRRGAAVVMAGALAFGAAACSDDGGDTGDTEETGDTGTVETDTGMAETETGMTDTGMESPTETTT